MLSILGITAPIFIIIAIGFLATRFHVINREQALGTGRFVISFALPALVIRALLASPIQEVFELNFLLAYGAASQAVFWLGFAFSRFIRKDTLAGSSLSALGMSVSNSGFIGYPIVAMAVGHSAAVALALCMLVENLLMIPMALAMAEVGHQSGGGLGQSLKNTFERLLGNPIIISISVGLFLSLLGWQPPAIIMKVIDMLANASAPVALFVIGANLYGLKGDGLLADVTQLAIGKLILHPLAVLLCLSQLPTLEPDLYTAAVLFACSPMMSIFPILGQRYGLERRCAATLVAATVLSFLTISFFVWVMT
ncbi:AEC family transporter [Azomonas macrocytogenes]|uniref:Permease n=1 Tax=Azomonas macrocytogenes TaxID=69962 RepID=A0A839T526_AZOMA|nr:hypothetical protein [Azomonas macrocytogenes]